MIIKYIVMAEINIEDLIKQGESFSENPRMLKDNKIKNCQLVWATGPKQYDLIREELNKEDLNIDNIDRIKVVPYIYNMEEILNISDLIVSRSGAMTITEIEKIGKPAIFIPFPHAAENHQEYNARALEKEGAAKVILDKELTSQILDDLIIKLTKDKNTLQEMGKKSKALSINDVEDKIYVEIKDVLKIK